MSVEVTTADLFAKIGKLVVQVDKQEEWIAELGRELAEYQAAITALREHAEVEGRAESC